MREREELKKAIEQTDRLLSRVRELEEENSRLGREKNEALVKKRSVSPFALPVHVSVKDNSRRRRRRRVRLGWIGRLGGTQDVCRGALFPSAHLHFTFCW